MKKHKRRNKKGQLPRHSPNDLAVPIVRPTGKYLEIGDRVLERDQGWFAAHPGERRYLRPFVPGEFPPEAAEASGVPWPPPFVWVLVEDLRANDGFVRVGLPQVLGRLREDGRIDMVTPIGSVLDNVPVTGWGQEVER